MTAVFGLLSLGIVQGESWGWGSARTVGALALAAGLTPVLVVRALRHPSPAMPVRLFAVRSFSVASLGTLLFAAAFFANLLCNVLFLTGVWQWSILRTAAAVLPGPLLAALVSPPAGRLADRFGHRVVIVPGAVAFGAGQLVCALTLTATPSYTRPAARPAARRTGHRAGVPDARIGGRGVAAVRAVRERRGGGLGGPAARRRARRGRAGGRPGEPARLEALAAFQRSWLVIAGTALACAAVGLLLARPARRS